MIYLKRLKGNSCVVGMTIEQIKQELPRMFEQSLKDILTLNGYWGDIIDYFSPGNGSGDTFSLPSRRSVLQVERESGEPNPESMLEFLTDLSPLNEYGGLRNPVDPSVTSSRLGEALDMIDRYDKVTSDDMSRLLDLIGEQCECCSNCLKNLFWFLGQWLFSVDPYTPYEESRDSSEELAKVGNAFDQWYNAYGVILDMFSYLSQRTGGNVNQTREVSIVNGQIIRVLEKQEDEQKHVCAIPHCPQHEPIESLPPPPFPKHIEERLRRMREDRENAYEQWKQMTLRNYWLSHPTPGQVLWVNWNKVLSYDYFIKNWKPNYLWNSSGQNRIPGRGLFGSKQNENLVYTQLELALPKITRGCPISQGGEFPGSQNEVGQIDLTKFEVTWEWTPAHGWRRIVRER